ncbi:hypothetical protein ABIA16_005181 [Sinorhizobium fredii]
MDLAAMVLAVQEDVQQGVGDGLGQRPVRPRDTYLPRQYLEGQRLAEIDQPVVDLRPLGREFGGGARLPGGFGGPARSPRSVSI